MLDASKSEIEFAWTSKQNILSMCRHAWKLESNN